MLYDIKHGFTSAMDDDLNISAATASLFSSVKKVNILVRDKKVDAMGASKILNAFQMLDSVLGFLEFEKKTDRNDVRKLIKARNQARQKHDWKHADSIRDQLRQHGIVVRNKKIVENG